MKLLIIMRMVAYLLFMLLGETCGSCYKSNEICVDACSGLNTCESDWKGSDVQYCCGCTAYCGAIIFLIVLFVVIVPVLIVLCIASFTSQCCICFPWNRHRPMVPMVPPHPDPFIMHGPPPPMGPMAPMPPPMVPMVPMPPPVPLYA